MIFEDSVGDVEHRFHLRVLALEGQLTLTSDGRYEQSLRHEVYVDGVLSDRPRWTDRGTFIANAALILLDPDLIENVEFIAQRSANRLDVTTDHVGEGQPASYRYTRN